MEKSKLVDFTAYICLIQSKLSLSQNQHYPNQFLNLSPKLFLWTLKQPFIKHFYLASCNVCPMVIPEIFAQTQGSEYWQLIHIKSALQHITRRWKAHIKNIIILWQSQEISLKLTEPGHQLNPFTPRSDWHETFLYKIHSSFSKEVTRILKPIR